MRNYPVLFILPMALAGCGGLATDFAVDVDRPADKVLAELARIDGSDVALLGLKPYSRETAEGGEALHFTIPAQKGYDSGEVIFRVSAQGDGASRIEVAVDLPQVIRGGEVLSDDLAEDALEEALTEWAAGFAQGSSNRGGVEAALTAFAIASQDTGDAMAKMAALGSSGFFASGGGDWGGSAESPAGEPEFGAPMDDTRGTIGQSPDSDYGAADYGATDDGWGE